MLPEPSPVTHLRNVFAQSPMGKNLLLLLQQQQRQNNNNNNIHRSSSSYSSIITKPKPEAIEAYDLEVVKAIRNSDIAKLRELHGKGKSLDACNRFGESLIHMACRRSDLPLVTFLVEECKVNVSVRDDFGRCILHDACWTTVPNFGVMDVLIRNVSPEMLLAPDVRGHTPFHYARKEHWNQWVQFLTERQDVMLRRLALVVQVVG